MVRAAQLAGALLLGLALNDAAMAGTRYELSVTRKESNLYEADGARAIILTKYCFEYVYSEDAVLDWDGRNGYIVFLGQGNRCDVGQVVVRQTVNSDKYGARVSREADNWYRIDELDLYLRTTMCLELSLSEEAILNWKGYGGDLIFLKSGRKCAVESVWANVR
jgi:hypothetical protein